jgi:hypothetical protein
MPDLWESGAAFAKAFSTSPRVQRLVRAWDLEGDDDLAHRVNEFTVRYSALKSAPILIGPRLNRLAETAELLESGEDVMEWLGDAVAVGEAFQVAIEFLRSRLPGYPILRVPHRKRGSPCLLETDPFLFRYFPWDRDLAKQGLQLVLTAPDMTKVACETDCADELLQLAAALAEWPSWKRFAELAKALTAEDLATLSEIGNGFGAAVKEEVVDEEAGDLLLARYQYRCAVLEEQVGAGEGRAKEYLLAFEAVESLVAILAGLIETLVVTDSLQTIGPDRFDLSGGGEVSRVNVKVSPDPLVLDPSRVVRVAGDSVPEGLVLIEELNHSFSFGENTDSSAEIRGKFVAL